MKDILPYLPVLERFFAMQGERWFANVQPRNQSWRKPESGDMWQFLKYSIFLFTHSFFSLFLKNGLQFFTSPTVFPHSPGLFWSIISLCLFFLPNSLTTIYLYMNSLYLFYLWFVVLLWCVSKLMFFIKFGKNFCNYFFTYFFLPPFLSPFLWQTTLHTC